MPHSIDQSPQSHDALCFAKEPLAMPKLLYILRTSSCANKPLLHEFDRVLRAGLESILNVQLSDEQWKQASLPVLPCGLGARSACMLTPSAFLESAADTLPHQEVILSASLAGVDDCAVKNAKTAWTSQANTSEPSDAVKYIQRAWDAHITMAVYNSLLQTCSSSIDQARLDVLVTPHVGDWLHAPPLTFVGLRLFEEAICMATGYRLGTNICQPHTCVCGQ